MIVTDELGLAARIETAAPATVVVEPVAVICNDMPGVSFSGATAGAVPSALPYGRSGFLFLMIHGMDVPGTLTVTVSAPAVWAMPARAIPAQTVKIVTIRMSKPPVYFVRLYSARFPETVKYFIRYTAELTSSPRWS